MPDSTPIDSAVTAHTDHATWISLTREELSDLR